MPDEPIEGQAGEGAPEGQPEFDLASTEVEVSGRKMTVTNLIKSYGESETSLRQLQNDHHGLKTKSEQLAWADKFQEAYNTNPSFRQDVDAAVANMGSSGVQTQQLNPQNQELQQIRQEQALSRYERTFDQIRNDGHELTKEQEAKILNEIATNPAVQDAKAAYWSLFGEQIVAKAREATTAQVSEQMSDNRAAYPGKPTGSSKPPPSKSVKDMTEAERDAYGLERVKGLDIYS